MSFDHLPFAPLSALATPDDHDPRPLLTEAAHNALCARLLSFKNILSPEHREALRSVLRGFTCLAFGGRGRIAYPLATGMGKTQAVVAWCAAAFQHGAFDGAGISIAVSTSHVAALCRLKRDLIEAGVPASFIGLVHSKRYDPRRVGCTGDIPDGYASEPSDPDAADRPILLATQQRIRGGRSEVFNIYQGHRRDLLIWDESLIASCAQAINWGHLEADLQPVVFSLSKDGAGHRFLVDAIRILNAERAGRVAGGSPQPLMLPMPATGLDGVRLELEALMKYRPAPTVRLVMPRLLELLTMAAHPLAMNFTDEGEAVVSYDVEVPADLEAVAVLDASYPIRELCLMDGRMQNGLSGCSELKRYDQVQVNFAVKGAGYETVSKDLNGKDSFYRAFVTQAVQASGPDANVLVFTFKRKSGAEQPCADVLRRALEDADLAPDAQVNGRPRVSFLTWGNETSLNDYAHCSHVVFAGVLHRSQIDLSGAMVGQAGNLLLSPSAAKVRDVVVSELAHCLYQAMSRGTCRNVRNGQADAMTVWLAMQDQRVRQRLDAIAPGMRWETWHPAGHSGSQAFKVARAVVGFLRDLPVSTNAISTTAIKRALDVTASPKVWTLALSAVIDQTTEWERVGKTWTRRIVIST